MLSLKVTEKIDVRNHLKTTFKYFILMCYIFMLQSMCCDKCQETSSHTAVLQLPTPRPHIEFYVHILCDGSLGSCRASFSLAALWRDLLILLSQTCCTQMDLS